MRFLLDQNFDRRFAAILRDLGHDVTVVSIDYPHGIPDHEVVAIAQREGRILLTHDTDFGELILREGLPHAGVILYRVRAREFAFKRDRLLAVLVDYADHLDRFVVVRENRVRIR
jgi:predicted nuclease of predicted toxin-antitoxin system